MSSRSERTRIISCGARTSVSSSGSASGSARGARTRRAARAASAARRPLPARPARSAGWRRGLGDGADRRDLEGLALHQGLEARDHVLRRADGLAPRHAADHAVQAIERALQRIDRGAIHVHAIADHRLEQRFDRVAEVADPGQADRARVALERVQVALQPGDGLVVGGRLAQPRDQRIGLVEDVVAFLDEDLDQVLVHVGQDQRALGLDVLGDRHDVEGRRRRRSRARGLHRAAVLGERLRHGARSMTSIGAGRGSTGSAIGSGVARSDLRGDAVRRFKRCRGVLRRSGCPIDNRSSGSLSSDAGAGSRTGVAAISASASASSSAKSWSLSEAAAGASGSIAASSMNPSSASGSPTTGSSAASSSSARSNTLNACSGSGSALRNCSSRAARPLRIGHRGARAIEQRDHVGDEAHGVGDGREPGRGRRAGLAAQAPHVAFERADDLADRGHVGHRDRAMHGVHRAQHGLGRGQRRAGALAGREPVAHDAEVALDFAAQDLEQHRVERRHERPGVLGHRHRGQGFRLELARRRLDGHRRGEVDGIGELDRRLDLLERGSRTWHAHAARALDLDLLGGAQPGFLAGRELVGDRHDAGQVGLHRTLAAQPGQQRRQRGGGVVEQGQHGRPTAGCSCRAPG